MITPIALVATALSLPLSASPLPDCTTEAYQRLFGDPISERYH